MTYDTLTGASVFAAPDVDPRMLMSRAERRAQKAIERRTMRHFRKQLRQVTKGSIFDEVSL